MRNALHAALTISLLITCASLRADDFDELEKKDAKARAANPFLGRAARCSFTTETHTLEESWAFQGETRYERKLLGVSGLKPTTGSYVVKKGSLVLDPGTADEKAVQFKIVKGGFHMIREVKDGKGLFKCEWMKR